MECRLKDLAQKITKGTTPSNIGEGFSDSGVMYFRSELIGKTKYVDKSAGLLYISDAVHDRLKRSQIEKNDILFSMAGIYLGKISLAGEEDYPANTNQAVAIIRLKENACNLGYLYYYMTQKWFNVYVNLRTAQAAQPNINLEQIGKLKINLPSRKVQDRISSILSVYDDLIENNNRRIQILEQMAENLYKEWFVRFRFPGYEQAEFENGIPKGWEVKHIGDICKIITGKKDANEATGDGDFPFFTCARETNVYTNEYFLDANAIIISGNGSYTGFVKKYAGKFDLYQRTYALYDFQNIGWLYVYWFMKIGFEREFMGGSRGSAIPYITKPNIEKYKILIPAKKELKLAEAFFASIHNECLYLEKTNRNLTRQRDMLLPRLMSGKLEV